MSAENPNEFDDIMVQCRNRLCTAFGHPKFVSKELALGEGELIYCGSCGYETRYIGANRPTKKIPFDPKTMNKTISLVEYLDG